MTIDYSAVRTEQSPNDMPTRPAAAGAAVWRGSELEQDSGWVYRLTGSDIAALDQALAQVPRDMADLRQVTQSSVPLPALSIRLAALQRDVVDGRGFVLIKGLPLERYNPLEAATLYWIIGQHFGVPVSQNAAGHLLGHVKDMGYAKGDPNWRGYQTSEALRYHTDSCDIVGLFCRRGAKRGGLSSIVSAGAVHNAIRDTRPDLLEVLYRPFAISRMGEIPAGKAAWYETPIFNDHGGRLTTIYPARDLRASESLPGAPRLSEAQREALALLDQHAEALSLKMEIAPGDIQFLQNHTILHGRTVYEDFDTPDARRHMLRLWLSAPNGRPLPPHFAERYGSVAQGAVRGGIICPGTELSTPIDAA